MMLNKTYTTSQVECLLGLQNGPRSIFSFSNKTIGALRRDRVTESDGAGKERLTEKGRALVSGPWCLGCGWPKGMETKTIDCRLRDRCACGPETSTSVLRTFTPNQVAALMVLASGPYASGMFANSTVSVLRREKLVERGDDGRERITDAGRAVLLGPNCPGCGWPKDAESQTAKCRLGATCWCGKKAA